MLRGNFVTINAVLKRKVRFRNNHLTFPLRELEKEEQTRSKASRRKEIKNRAEMVKQRIEK
jgi:hypothetical protein